MDRMAELLEKNLKREDTRLRDWNKETASSGSRPRNRVAWKEKILDYEIETPSKITLFIVFSL